ncbi:MAG: phospho-sugar mutase [Planctomycetaceae bacterium]
MSTPSTAELKSAWQAVQTAVSEKRLSAAAAGNLEPWLNEPAYAASQPRLLELIQRGQFPELERLFWEKIPFGTGGRRGPMADLGSATINARTIAESAYGLGVYVKETAAGRPLRAVIACDTRNRSQEFARVSATVLAALGFEVFCFNQPRATPELSFAVRHLHCATGIMISASHNPPADNGFKAYWSTGGQVLAPHDKNIIARVESAREIPVADFDQAVKSGQIQLIDEAVDQAYIDAVTAQSLSKARDIPALFTPLHGVGETSVYRVIQAAGFTGVGKYEPQCSQDGNFPHVPDHLPNPERPAVFQPAIDACQNTDVALILASDPDADRLAIAVRDRDDKFQTLTGNQLGSLLVDYVLEKRRTAGTLSAEHFVVETLVTTPMVSAIAQSYGVRAIDNLLVGFKYIAATMDAEGPEKFVFGTEESLGYLAGSYARDKDAAIAALYTLELAAELHLRGQTLLDRLDELSQRHGVYLEDQYSMTCPGPKGNQQIAWLMKSFRESPPATFGPMRLERVQDFQRHEIRTLPDNTRSGELPAPSGDLMIAEGTAGACRLRIALRPSGTEPKIKLYLFAVGPSSEGVAAGRRAAQDALTLTKNAANRWADDTVGRML